MIYCMSDIHGRIDLFEKMLEKINLQSGDMLYVIGDSIDRGGGLKVIQKIKELHDKGMATLLFGNHELMLIHNFYNHKDNKYIEDALDRIKEIQDKSERDVRRSNEIKKNPSLFGMIKLFSILDRKVSELSEMNDKQVEIQRSLASTAKCSSAEEWETFKDLAELPESEKNDILKFMMGLQYSKEITVNGKNYLLVHGGISDNEVMNLFVRDNFYMNEVSRKTLGQFGFKEDCTIIFGHTTTRDINIKLYNKYVAPHKIWFDKIHNDKIGIDCGASYPNGQLACLRLDDMKEFYVVNEEKFITPIDKINACFEEIKMEVLNG